MVHHVSLDVLDFQEPNLTVTKFISLEFIFYVGWFKIIGMLYDPYCATGAHLNLDR